MPIEIKEVVIRAVVSGSGGGKPKANAAANNDQASGSPDSNVTEAVRQVLEILQDKEER